MSKPEPVMNSDPRRPPRSFVHRWNWKFLCAFRGLVVGLRGQSSCYVHLPAGVVVIALAWWLEVDALQWCLLLLCIGAMLASEYFNSAIETLAKAITLETDPRIRDALDIASAAVLLASFTAATVGVLILGPKLLERLGL